MCRAGENPLFTCAHWKVFYDIFWLKPNFGIYEKKKPFKSLQIEEEMARNLIPQDDLIVDNPHAATNLGE